MENHPVAGEASAARRTWARPRVTVAAMIVSIFVPRAAQQSRPADQFISLNNVRLHYVDWGGVGETLLFLTSFGAAAHEFDDLAPAFTDHFRVLGLTRRGRGESDKPPCCYDTRTLVDDIRAFLDAKTIGRVTLVGYSIAGVEETMFAGVYPERVSRLVFLEANGDPKSAYELANNPRTRYPLPLPEATGSLGEIARGTRQADRDYTKVSAPALAFCVIYEGTFIPAGADDALKARLLERYEKYGRPFEEQQREHFRRDMKRGRIVELHGTDHSAFIHDAAQLRIVASEMRAFLLAP